jgi:y4mF family transcriptional regulator
MKHQILNSDELGIVVRAVRKTSRVRQDDLAMMAGVSKQFVADVERGKPTAQIGLVIHLLQQLGLTFTVTLPDDTRAEMNRIRNKRASGESSDSSDSDA